MAALAIAQLLRIPNVFTAFADIALAAFVAGYLTEQPATFFLLLAASGCLYCSGMAWNDIFDRKHDAESRAVRPIPSGRIALRTAIVTAAGLMSVGIVLPGIACEWRVEISYHNSFFVALSLASLILLYDSWLKRTHLGPVAMGGCRALNILFGLSGGSVALEVAAHLAGTIGVYIVGVTAFARTEERTSRRGPLFRAWLVILVGMVLGLTLPAHLPEGSTPSYTIYLLIAWACWINWHLKRAVDEPKPDLVQSAVKQCILGLIVFDAILATAFVGWPGLLIVLLLLPARWLGQWVYST